VRRRDGALTSSAPLIPTAPWSSNRRYEKLPDLTEPAQQLADEFVTMMRDQQWDLDQRVTHLRPLVILLSWLGRSASISAGGGVPGRHGCPGLRSAGVGTRSAFFRRGTMVKRRVW